MASTVSFTPLPTALGATSSPSQSGADTRVSALAKRYPMSFAAVQKHVAVLEAAGLVTKERRGRERLVHTDVDTVQRARMLLDGIEELWRAWVDRIDDLLATEQQTPGGKR